MSNVSARKWSVLGVERPAESFLVPRIYYDTGVYYYTSVYRNTSIYRARRETRTANSPSYGIKIAIRCVRYRPRGMCAVSRRAAPLVVPMKPFMIALVEPRNVVVVFPLRLCLV